MSGAFNGIVRRALVGSSCGTRAVSASTRSISSGQYRFVNAAHSQDSWSLQHPSSYNSIRRSGGILHRSLSVTSILKATPPSNTRTSKPSTSKPSSPKVRFVKAEYTPPPPSEEKPSPPPPPQPQYSPSIDSDAHQWLFYSLIGLNTVVFMGWQYAQESAQNHKDPAPFLFMYRNFLAGSYNLHEGRWWTLFTSCISHANVDHFLLNMISFAFMSPPILTLVGPSIFLGLYFGAGLGCSLASIAWKRYITPVLHKDEAKQAQDPNQYFQTSHGASGSIYAVMTTFALLSPHTTFTIFFIIPLPAWLGVSGILTYDFVSALTRPDRLTDSAGHVGGVASGYLFWKLVLGGLRRRY